MWQTQFDTDTLGPQLAGYRTQLDAHTDFIRQQLADGRSFLTGDKPAWADIHAMWDPWFLNRFAPAEGKRAYTHIPSIAKWLERLAAIGQGTRVEMYPDEALDVAQEAFIKAYRAIDRFRGDSAFYTWLYRIAINTAKNWLVARKRRPPATDIDAADAEHYDMDSRLKEQGTPENELMREEIKRTVFDTIAALPDDLRTAIMLREMEGMSYEDIAITMDCPIGTVRSRIFRAREAIDEKLKPLVEGN